jgi:hypothetical protein
MNPTTTPFAWFPPFTRLINEDSRRYNPANTFKPLATFT